MVSMRLQSQPREIAVIVPGGVDEANGIGVEGTVDRVQDSEFSKSLDGEE